MDFISIFSNNIKVLIPELFLVLALSYILVHGSVYSTAKDYKYPVLRVSFCGLASYTVILTLFLTLNNPFPDQTILNSTLIHDTLTNNLKIFILFAVISTLIISKNYLKTNNINAFEYQILLLLALLGLVFLVSSNDLISIYIAIELQSLSLYVLAAFKRGSAFSTEASIKYFILGAFSSGLLLFGSSLIYGFVGSTNFEDISRLLLLLHYPDVELSHGLIIGLIFLSCGLLFKLGVAPFHMWLPDVYEGAPSSVTALFAITPKLALFGVFLRVIYGPFYDLFEWWQQMIILTSAMSIVLATFAAIYQKRLKRFLAYSSIGHVGYILIGCACGTFEGIQSVLLYVIIYFVMSLNVWSIILSLEKEQDGQLYKYISDLSGLRHTNPLIALTLVITVFSMAGIPPIAGFCAKLYVFLAAMSSSIYILALLGIFTSVIGAFYYLRWIKVIFFEKEPLNSEFNLVIMSRGKSLIISFTTLFILFFFSNPSCLLLLTHEMALSLV